jgi:hypothetical protein
MWLVRDFRASANALVRGERLDQPQRQSDWPAVLPLLTDLAERADALVTSVNAKAVYYLGRPGYTLSATLTEGRPEFANDPRLAAPVIKELASLKQLVAENDTGLLIAEDVHWGSQWSVSQQVRDYAEGTMTSAELPRGMKLHVYVWGRPLAERVGERRSKDDIGLGRP